MINTPDRETAEQQQARKKQHGDQLRLDYRFIFNGEKGKEILKDLKHRFGWRYGGDIESPSASFGASSRDVFLKEGMKEPIRYILAMTEEEASNNDPKQTRAINE